MKDLMTEIWESIRRNKLRTALTGFAVAWGIFMLIVLLGAGNGLMNAFMDQGGHFATNTMAVFGGVTSKPANGYQTGRRIELNDQPANGVIFCVVVNTDYRYTGDAIRKHHWDYRLRFGDNALAPADIRQKWYFYERTITDKSYDEQAILSGIEDVKAPTLSSHSCLSSTPTIYSLSGQPQSTMQRGINLVRDAQGRMKKVYMR